jgi:hypothetical protein
MDLTQDIAILIRTLYQWERGLREARRPGPINTRSAAEMLGWDPTRMNLVLRALKEHHLIDLQPGAGSPFIAPGFNLSVAGWLQCEGAAFDAEPISREGEGLVQPVNQSTVRIFISHSSADGALAAKLVALLQTTLVVPDGDIIRCTSVEGYGLEGGDRTAERLRAELKDCSVVLGMLTKSGVSSSYVLLELGAAWGFGKKAIPLLGSGVSFDELPGPFPEIHALRMTDRSAIAGLAQTISNATGFALRTTASRTQAALEDFVTEALQHGLSAPAAPVTAPMPPMPEDDIVLRLESWLNALPSIFSNAAITFDTIDREAQVPAGTALRLIASVLEASNWWAEVKRSTSLIVLYQRPVPKSARAFVDGDFP